MSEAVRVAVGQTLREAREAQGISLDDAATRLRLMHRQIEAMETEDFDSLGQPVFARGFVRNYARLLGLAPEPLLAGMEGAITEPVVVQREAPLPPRSWLTSPWLLLFLAGLLALAAVPVALYWWLNSDDEETGLPGRTVPTVAPATSAPAPVVPPPGPSAEPASTLPPSPAESAVVADASPAQPAETEPVATETAVQPAAPAPGVQGALQLEFGAESWVEIRDGGGRMLHRQLNQPGSSATVHGEPPFDLVVGNAGQVRMTYNGRPIDLKPFIDVTVARFTLEE